MVAFRGAGFNLELLGGVRGGIGRGNRTVNVGQIRPDNVKWPDRGIKTPAGAPNREEATGTRAAP